MYNLINKVTVVTGGASGIGSEIVKEFLKEGVKYIAVIDVDTCLGTALEKDLRETYGEEKIQFFNIDVTNNVRVTEILREIATKFDTIDVIVNNAGIACEDQNNFKKVIEINFSAVVASTLTGLELMRKDKGGIGGTIINISSIAALTLLSPSIFVYGATKSAVLHFSNCIGMEDYYRYTNVRVLTVCFGLTNTDILRKMKGIDEVTNDSLKNILGAVSERNEIQSPVVAAQGLVQSYKTGNTGSTWVIDNSKISEITDDVKQAYKHLSKNISI